MLEQIRKHHFVLMSIVAVVVIIAFAFMPDSRTGHAAGDKPIVTVNGEDLYRDDISAVNGQMVVIQALARQLDPADQMARFTDPVIQYANTISSVVRRYNDTSRETDLDFVLNVTILRQQAETLGVKVEREDLEKFVQTLPAFQTQGKFDSAKYEGFVSAGALGNRDATEKRLYTMLRDMLVYQKLNDLIGLPYAPSPAVVDYDYATQNEQTTAWTAVISRDGHPGEPVTDEDMQKFYDAEKDKKAEAPSGDIMDAGKPLASGPDPVLLSPEQRTVEYVIVAPPELPKPPVPVPALNTAGLSDEEKKAKEEEHKAKQDEYTKAQAAYDEQQKTWQEKVKTSQKAAESLSNALNAEDRGAKTFAEIAKESQLEPKTAGPVAQDALPAELKADPSVATAIFSTPKGHNVEPPVRLRSGGYAFFEVTEVIEPSVRPLDEVKDAIRTKLVAERTDNALRGAGDTARSKIVEALTAGKSFADAATEAGLSATALPVFSSKKPAPPTTPNAQLAASQTSGLNAGEVSQPVSCPEGLLLVFVEKKGLPNDPKMAEQKEQLRTQRTLGGSGPFARPSPLFGAWFQARRTEAAEVRNDRL